MPLSREQTHSFLHKGFSRRGVGRIATLPTAGVMLPFYNEYAMAQEAIAKVAPHGGRYSPFGEQGDFATAIAETEGVKESYVAAFAGSSDPLHRSTCAFTAPNRSWCMGEPGYGGGAPEFIGSKTVRVPLRKDFAHDVEAMIKADPNAGEALRDRQPGKGAGYGWAGLFGDCSGGAIAELIALPYGLAMASLMGPPPVLGVFTSILTAPVIALLGRNPVLIGGTASATVPFIALAVRHQGAGGAAKVSIVASIIMMGFCVIRLGRHIARVPHAVVTGFSCGSAP